jgi:hypothetical protein
MVLNLILFIPLLVAKTVLYVLGFALKITVFTLTIAATVLSIFLAIGGYLIAFSGIALIVFALVTKSETGFVSQIILGVVFIIGGGLIARLPWYIEELDIVPELILGAAEAIPFKVTG